MNLKEKLAKLKAKAEELLPKVAAGDPAAMKLAEKLAADIEETQKAIDAADAFEQKLKGIGAAGKRSAAAASPKSLG